MSNGEFLDDFMRLMYEEFGKPDSRKPGAEESPPRNVLCGKCGYWFAKGMHQYHISSCRKVRGLSESYERDPEEPNQ